jgi:hypothetical protein
MYIAQQLKEKNIAEYLLYMWQVEDIIRAYGGDIDRLRSEYLTRFTVDDAQRAELEQWYANLAEMMRSEQVLEKGHLQINKNTMAWLEDLHARLLHSPKYPYYSMAYYKALPFIVELRSKGEHTELSEIENCFDALYGVMMLRLKGTAVSEKTEEAMGHIRRFIGMLADYYPKDKKGELEF